MGNRALIQFDTEGRPGPQPAVYVHWNGGPESVYAFLDFMSDRGYRFDNSYGTARLAELYGRFFGGTLSVGIELYEAGAEVDPCGCDNGVYLVSAEFGGYKVRREHADVEELEVEEEAHKARTTSQYREIREWLGTLSLGG